VSKIALFQMTSGIDPAKNAAALVQAISDSASAGAKMVFTPEMSGLLDRNGKRAASSIFSEADDPVLEAVCVAAKKNGIWVALGSLAISPDGDGERYANRSYLIDDQGQVRARYDKIHLFDIDLPTGESWRESNRYRAGEGAVVVQTPIGDIGLSICYDVRFPTLYQGLSESGAQILSVPAAFTVPTGKAHWHILLRARAIENAAWVIAAAQVGDHEDGRSTYGHSLVVSPWGEVVLDMGKGQGLGFADVDVDKVERARQQIPVIKHRRTIGEVALYS
jgi:deaminated glutathione amidase